MNRIFQILLYALCIIYSNQLSAQSLKLNQIQVIGSHNSYKSQLAPEILDYLSKINPAASQSLAYSHIPLEAQLDLGLRNLELDVFHDPEGGRFSNPKGLDIIKSGGGNIPDYDPTNALAKPGLKLFHIQDLDFQSHYLLFSDALKALKLWSENNPNHSPIFILINAKDGNIAGTRPVLPFTAAALDSIDLEIRTHLGLNKLITPDDVMGNQSNLESAVLAGQWPTAGFRIINGAERDEAYIRELVQKGYMIRTRADSDTKQARTNDYSTFEKAKASGAQVISTDYYIPSTYFNSDYKISFEGNVYERPNPILIKK